MRPVSLLGLLLLSVTANAWSPVAPLLRGSHRLLPYYGAALLSARRTAAHTSAAAPATMSMTPNTPLGHRIGSADAPVKLEVWYDFACPFSAKSFLLLTKTVLPAYTNSQKSFIVSFT
jgi:hypothetical protein